MTNKPKTTSQGGGLPPQPSATPGGGPEAEMDASAPLRRVRGRALSTM